MTIISIPHWTTALPELTEIISQPRFGLLTDFDGTLSHFRPYPELPHMTDRNRDFIIQFSQRLPVVALISGRAAFELRDVAQLGATKVAYVGNHGLEELRGAEAHILPEALEWEARMTAFYHELGEPPLPGIRYQHKRVTMSVTYRNVDDPAAVRLMMKDKLDALNEGYGFHLHEGRTIWEVKPPIPLHKGTAIRALVEEYQLDSAIYLGDDITDIPALDAIRDLRAAGQIKGLAVSVHGETDVPEALAAGDVSADSVDDVTNIFAWIADHLPVRAG